MRCAPARSRPLLAPRAARRRSHPPASNPSILLAAAQVHLLHIIPVPMPEVIGGIGAMDSIVTVDPDPATDLKHVSRTSGGSVGLISEAWEAAAAAAAAV